MSSRDVQLFTVGADTFVGMPALAAGLSMTEAQRADAMSRPQIRARFVAGRYALRSALSPLLGRLPREVPIWRQPDGDLQVPGLHCSLSHSGSLVLVALSQRLRIGVDIQSLRPRECHALAVQLGWRTLASWLVGRPASAQTAVFMQTWARAEAMMKSQALRELPLDDLDLGEPLGGLARGCHVLIGRHGPVTVMDLAVGEGYVAALAVASAQLPTLVLRRLAAPRVQALAAMRM